MKIMALLIATGGLLLTMAAPASARDAGHYDHNRADRYSYYTERRSEMPRRLHRERGFRAWYRRSPHQRRRAISWDRLYDVYRWERRYPKRHYNDRYRYERYDDDRHEYRSRRKRH